jgi:hypothetical protein
MDPDANLFEQLELSRQILHDPELSDEMRAAKAEQLAELVEALHGWITAGGFLPWLWRRAR